MRTATYTAVDGSKFSVEYDERAPCHFCGLPVVEASMGGTAMCPWCDTGTGRDGHQIMWPPRKATSAEYEAAVKAYWP